jgi:hypothetical protein
MQQMLMTIVLLALLSGCAQPQIERPQANGAYLVIEGEQAWAVLVSDGRRVEEAGRVLDVIRLPGHHSSIAASYVIDTPNCGKLQWLTERHGAAEGETTLLPAAFNEELVSPGCVLAQGLSRAWTALDYSG